jgi:hypothetical protein
MPARIATSKTATTKAAAAAAPVAAAKSVKAAAAAAAATAVTATTTAVTSTTTTTSTKTQVQDYSEEDLKVYNEWFKQECYGRIMGYKHLAWLLKRGLNARGVVAPAGLDAEGKPFRYVPGIHARQKNVQRLNRVAAPRKSAKEFKFTDEFGEEIMTSKEDARKRAKELQEYEARIPSMLVHGQQEMDRNSKSSKSIARFAQQIEKGQLFTFKPAFIKLFEGNLGKYAKEVQRTLTATKSGMQEIVQFAFQKENLESKLKCLKSKNASPCTRDMSNAVVLQYLGQKGVPLRVGKEDERVLFSMPEDFCLTFDKECGKEAAGQINCRSMTFGEIQRLIKFITVPAQTPQDNQDIIDDLFVLQTARNAKKNEQVAAKKAKTAAEKAAKKAAAAAAK